MTAKKAGKVKSAKSAGQTAIGIIGGSGLYAMNGLTNTREVRVKTPFGEPSDAIVLGTLEGKRVAFLARHGRGHRILPGEINYRANVYAMKYLGERGRFAEGGLAAGRVSRSRSVFRSHKEPRLYFFWRRNRCARGVIASDLRPVVGRPGGCLRA